MRALCGNLRVECGSLQTGFSESLRKKRAGLICGRDIPRAAGSVWLQPALPLGLPAALAAPAPSRRLCLQGLLVTEMASVTVQGQPCKGPEAHASRVAQVTGHLPVCVEYSLQDHSGLEPAGPRARGGGGSPEPAASRSWSSLLGTQVHLLQARWASARAAGTRTTDQGLTQHTFFLSQSGG